MDIFNFYNLLSVNQVAFESFSCCVSYDQIYLVFLKQLMVQSDWRFTQM